MFDDFVNIKDTTWTVFKLPALMCYISIVAQSGELSIRCADIKPTAGTLNMMEFYLVYDVEILAFMGIMMGLVIWLALKTVLNFIYETGPKFSKTTHSVRQAEDLLTRNFQDTSLTIGLVWSVCVNVYFYADPDNVFTSKMDKHAYGTIFYLLCMDFLQFSTVCILKFVPLFVEDSASKATDESELGANNKSALLQQDEDDLAARVNIEKLREEFGLKSPNRVDCSCFRKEHRALLKSALTAFSFLFLPCALMVNVVIHLLRHEISIVVEGANAATAEDGSATTPDATSLLGVGAGPLSLQSSSVDGSGVYDPSAEGGSSVELYDFTLNLSIFQIWIVLVTINQVFFGVFEMRPYMSDFYRKFKNPDLIQRDVKTLGAYSSEDPYRNVEIRESIFDVCFAASLKWEYLQENLEVPARCKPHKTQQWDLFMTAIVCAICQIIASGMILVDFNEQGSEALIVSESEESPSALIDGPFFLIKFVCAIIFHCIFFYNTL